VYTVFATHRMSAGETELMDRSLGIVPANLVEENMEAAFGRAGLAIQLKEAIGTEWREHGEEHGGSVSTALQRLSRLRRQRPKLVEGFGAELVDHVEAALHWEPFLLLGKLQPTVYVLGR
jgi:hypothetical protein